MRGMFRTTAIVMGTTLSLLIAGGASAMPALQLYIEGATYDTTTETWLTTSDSFNLWVIGGTGDWGDIDDVMLSAAVSSSETGTVTITPTTTSIILDPSTPIAPVDNGLSADGAIPQLSDGSDLPSHGIYGAGTQFFEWSLGDFTLTDSQCGDFINSFPTTLNKDCQINVYEVDVTGYTTVHFDAYDTIVAYNHSKFAPFSHDAGTVIPEPSSALLFLIGVAFVARRVPRT